MLEKISYNKSQKSIFICDRCRTRIDWSNKNSVSIGIHKEHPVKKWDLCDRCYAALKRGIEKEVRKYEN